MAERIQTDNKRPVYSPESFSEMALPRTKDGHINYPEWTEYNKKNGLDPLGMQNSSFNLYQAYLPGISNVTLRMRYYGLYAWLSQTYAEKVGSTNPEEWKRFLRRAEALYALISYHHGGERGVAGINWAQRTLDNSEGEAIEFGPAAEPGSDVHYLQQAWGAYGAAYGSQLFAIGILTSSSDHEIPVPSVGTGEKLASVLDETLGDVGALFFDTIQRGQVSKTELDMFSVLSPSNIPLAGEERALYEDILLQPGSTEDAASLSRRLSLLLILKITALLGREPSPSEVRWILYSGYDQAGQRFNPGSTDLQSQRERWWVYHASDLCHIALETLLRFTLDSLALYPEGITLSRLIPMCVDQILEASQESPARWDDLVEALRPTANAYADDDPASEWSLCDEIMRGPGKSNEIECTPVHAWKAVELLATLHKRVRDDGHDITAELGGFDPEAFRSLLSETRFLDGHVDKDFRETLGRLIEERVVRRHLWVALRKFRHQGDYTFLIETDEGRLRLREKDGPVFTNPRLGPAITFLKDIHLLGSNGLTSFGRQAVGQA